MCVVFPQQYEPKKCVKNDTLCIKNELFLYFFTEKIYKLYADFVLHIKCVTNDTQIGVLLDSTPIPAQQVESTQPNLYYRFLDIYPHE